MVKATITIPVYNCKINVIIDKDINPERDKLYKKYKHNHDGGTVYAEVISNPDSVHIYHILYGSNDLTMNLFVHEITHLGGMILADRGHKTHDDEPLAYLNGYLASELYKILQKNNIQFIQKPTKANGKTKLYKHGDNLVGGKDTPA